MNSERGVMGASAAMLFCAATCASTSTDRNTMSPAVLLLRVAFIVVSLTLAFACGRLRSATASDVADNANWQNRLSREYPESQTKLHGALKNVRCEVHCSCDVYEADVTLCSLDDTVQEILHFDSTRRIPGYPDVRVNTYALEYDFQADKSGAGAFRLANVANGVTADSVKRRNAMRFLRVGQFLGASFQVWNRTVANLLADPTFNVVGVSVVGDRNETERVQIEFSVEDWERAEQHRELLRSGTIVLAPGLDWALCRYDLEIDVIPAEQGEIHKQRYVADIDCARWGREGLVLPRRIDTMIEHQGPDGQRSANTWTAEFRSVEFGTVEPKQFRLSAFGLPDSQLGPIDDGQSRNVRSLVFWFLVLNAVACAAGWYVLKRRAGRHG